MVIDKVVNQKKKYRFYEHHTYSSDKCLCYVVSFLSSHFLPSPLLSSFLSLFAIFLRNKKTYPEITGSIVIQMMLSRE